MRFNLAFKELKVGDGS